MPACHVAAASHVPGKCKRAEAEKERRQPVALVVVTVTRMQRRLVAGEPGRQRVCGQRPVGDRERDERNSYGERNSHDGRSKGRHARVATFRGVACELSGGRHSGHSGRRGAGHAPVSDSGSASGAVAGATAFAAWCKPRRAEVVAAVTSSLSRGSFQQRARFFNAPAGAHDQKAARVDSDSDYRCPRPGRSRDRQRLELEQLGYLPAHASEDGGEHRAGQERDGSHSGRSDGEPKPHRHRDLIGIDGRS